MAIIKIAIIKMAIVIVIEKQWLCIKSNAFHWGEISFHAYFFRSYKFSPQLNNDRIAAKGANFFWERFLAYSQKPVRILNLGIDVAHPKFPGCVLSAFPCPLPIQPG